MEREFKKYEEYLLQLKDSEEEIILIKGHTFIIRKALEMDIKRVAKGYFCLKEN